MDILEIKGTLRPSVGGRTAKDLRKKGHVPCVVYGGQETLHFEAHEFDFKKLVFTDKVYIVKLDLGSTTIKAIMKEIQFAPLTDKVRHIDFQEVNETKPVLIDIPVKFVGSPVGAQAGGNFVKRRRTLKVKALLNDLPNTIDVEVSHLDIGNMMRIGDIPPTTVKIVEDMALPLCAVTMSRAAMKNAQAAANSK
jgi:large subunit ribosomal protein L25